MRGFCAEASLISQRVKDQFGVRYHALFVTLCSLELSSKPCLQLRVLARQPEHVAYHKVKFLSKKDHLEGTVWAAEARVACAVSTCAGA